MALPAGLPPASFRLEDGCLMCSATAALNWSARQDLHLRSLGPRPSVLAATLRADDPGGPGARRGFGFLWRRASFVPWNDARRKIWRIRRELHPQPSRRQRVAPLIELRIQMVGSAGNAPVRRFRL